MTSFISVVVEGKVDEAVVQRLLPNARIYPKYGKANVRSRIRGYNAAARLSPFFILVDLDADYDCAPELINDWLPDCDPRLYLRVAVRAVEAWLLGDRQRIAAFLRVKQSLVPEEPEMLPDPKRAIVDLARLSKDRALRDDMVPQSRSGRPVGTAYSSRMMEYINSAWRPEVAAQSCDSLRRALNVLRTRP